jgi:signal transduction histidine kinase
MGSAGVVDPWQLLGAGLVGLWLGAVLTLTRLPATPLSRAVRGLTVCAALWAVGDLIAGIAPDLFWKQLGVSILYSGVIFLPAVWWIVALRWSEERAATPSLDLRGRVRAPFVFAGAMWIAMVTNPWHGQFLVPVVGGRNLYGPLWWVMAIPNYGLILGAGVVVLRVLRRMDARPTRRQAAFLIIASGITLAANWVYVSGVGPAAGVTLPLISVAALILLVGMLRQGLFGVLPLALQVMASHDSDGLLVMKSGCLVHANPRALELLSPVDVAPGASLPDALGLRLHRVGRRAVRDGDDWRQTLLAPGGVLYRYDGDTPRWLRVSGQPVHGRRGRLLAHCLRIHDATEEQRAEIELRRARSLESVAELSRGVAHDLRNLLAVVTGNADLLLAELPGTREVQRKLHKILRSSQQAVELAGQLQLYAGGAPPTRLRVDLSELVRDTIEMLDPGELPPQMGRPLEVELELASGPLPVEAEPTQLRQLLQNLYVNARDALDGPGGRIRIVTGRAWLDPARAEHLVLGRDRPAADHAFLRVADTGPGMDPEAQERAFEPYFSTKGKQRGVGLATVFGIAQSHGALIALESRVGRGTVFTIYFPIPETP